MEWFEELPQLCPPADAIAAQGQFYRIAKAVPTETDDYFSQRRLQPFKAFSGAGIDECIVRAVSLFHDKENAAMRLRLPKFRNHKIVVVNLEPKDGMIKKTFGPSHYSWWRSKEFDYTKAQLAI